MSKSNLAKIATNLKFSMAKHSPEILTGIGIAGMIATTVLAVKATPKALEYIDTATYEKEEPLTPVETVKACWKCYIACIIYFREISIYSIIFYIYAYTTFYYI